MKLVSDFDGVWTDQDKEAAYIVEYFIKKISEISKFEADEINQLFEQCRTEMSKTPYDYGWFYGSKVSAYYREDSFTDINALFNFIQRVGNKNSFSVFRQQLNEIKKSIKDNGFESTEKFINVCFDEAAGIFKQSGKLSPYPNGKAALDKVLKKGVQIVVLSNSSSLKIVHLFHKMGKQPTNERSFKKSDVHAIGNANKFVINSEFDSIPAIMKTNGRYDVQLRRKHYYDILLDEKPDYVLGNVFSLDIALPLYLRLHDSRFNNLKLILKIHKYTPEWVKEFLDKDALKGVVYIIDDISELPDIIKW